MGLGYVGLPLAAKFGRQRAALDFDIDAALQNANILVICNDWQQLGAPDFAEMEERMTSKVTVNGRNLERPHKLQAEDWGDLAVGRSN